MKSSLIQSKHLILSNHTILIFYKSAARVGCPDFSRLVSEKIENKLETKEEAENGNH